MTENTFIKQFTFSPAPMIIDVDFIKWQDREIPKTIYKYRNWKNNHHKRIITNLEFYFPTPQELNDPFDSLRYFNHEELLDPEIYAKYLEVAAVRIKKNTNYSDEEIAELLANDKLKEIDAASVEEMERLIKDNDNWMNSLMGTYTASLVNDSILLWSHYADSHKGFCVGLDTEILLKSIKHGGSAKAAQYEPKITLTSLLDDVENAIFEKTFSKYEAWGYEFEYRILAGQLPKHKIFPSPEVLKEIIFGINMPKRDKDEIICRAKKKNPAINFFEAKKVRNEYRIEIIPF